MKNKTLLPILILLLASFCGSLTPIFSKLALRSFSPLSIIFLRYLFALPILLIIQKRQGSFNVKRQDRPFIAAALLFWIINVFSFQFAIQAGATAIVSQLMFFLSPVIVLLISRQFLKQRFDSSQIVGIILATLGALFITFGSHVDASKMTVTSLGTFFGNILLIVSVVGWSLYLVFSKKVTDHYSPLLITTYTGIATFTVALPFFVYEVVRSKFPPPTVGLDGIIGILGMAFVISIAMVFLYQWGIKHTSAFAGASVIYIAPLSTAFFSIPLFSERVTWQLLASAIFISIGLHFAVIKPLIKQKS